MQETIVSQQVISFVTTVLLGILIGLAYDVLRVIRFLFHPSRRILFFYDLLFWVLMTGTVFFILLVSSWGEVRAYVFIGLGSGALFYYLLLSHFCFHLLLGAAKLIRTACSCIFGPLIRLVGLVIRIAHECSKVLHWPIRMVKLTIKKIKGYYYPWQKKE